jgi:hypothetical protein
LNQYPGIYTYGGKSGSPLYIGVDIGWYSGASWARPVLTAGNPLCNPSLVNGTTCSTSTMSIGIVQYYVPSCAYQLGSNNQMISMGNEGYIWIDNFEMTGLCQSLPGQSGGGADGQNVYVRYSGMSGPVVFENLYIHGASHLQFAGWLTSAACNVNPSVCLNITAFVGSVTGNGGNPGDTVIFNVVDFADSDTGGGQLLCGGGLYNAAYNVFRYTSSCVPKPLHVFHDNLYEYFFENGHSNLIESFDVGPISAFYNNVIRHVDTSGATGSVLLWLGPQTGGTDYIFNNLIYDVGGVEYLNTGGTGLTTNKGNYTYFNNTFQSNVNQPILRMSAPPIGTVLDTNNHYIDDASQYNLDSPGSWTATTPLLVTQANAKKAGYTSGSSYAYQPASANCNGNPGSCTVGNGINKESYCTALSAAASSDPFLSDAASACATDTHYACNYDTSTHSVSCPARPVVARPTSAAWNIGAYESNGTQANAPNSPSNLTAVVQ